MSQNTSFPYDTPHYAKLDIYDTEPTYSDRIGPNYLQRLHIEQRDACDALEVTFDASGKLKTDFDPYIRDANGDKQPVSVVDESNATKIDFFLTKGFQSLPLNACRKRREALGPLLVFSTTVDLTTTFRLLVLTWGGRCGVGDVRKAFEDGFKRLERFSNSTKRTYPGIQVIFATAEASVRDQAGVPICDLGGLSYHPHINVIFTRNDTTEKEFQAWLRRLKRKFSLEPDAQGAYIRDCGTLKSIVAACTYITKLQDVRAILDAGEFPEWHMQINGLRMMRSYGELKKYKAWLKADGKRIKAVKIYEQAAPVWSWEYRKVDIQCRPKRSKSSLSTPPVSVPVVNKLVSRIKKQKHGAYWRPYAIFKNAAPGMTGKDLLASAGLPTPM